MAENSEENQPRSGFQKSETSSVQVVHYAQGGDPVIYGASGAMDFKGRYRQDSDHAIIAVNTAKTLEGAGQFSVQLKPAKGVSDTILDRVVDDDWIDIVFKRHDRVWHTMRGTVDRVSRSRAVAGSGATSWIYSISGRDFQKIWEMTPLWFNRLALENVEGGWAYKIYSQIPNLGGDPSNVVQAFLQGWFEALGNAGRVNWVMPATIPNTKGNFLDDIKAGWNVSGFSGVPKRKAIDPNLMNPSGTLWTLAKGWSDPAFCELFCDLGKQGVALGPNDVLDINDSTMSVFFRDRPFPFSLNVQDDTGAPPAGLQLGLNSAWFQLPLHIVNRQEIVSDEVSRDGSERMNAYFVSPQIQQDLLGAGGMDMTQPLWDPDDIIRHGLRRYDINTCYKTDAGTLLLLSVTQRYMLLNWYAMNPYLLSGTISLGHGRPDIHVGTRIRIPGEGGDTTLDETYYVEGVNHSWSMGPGIRTTLQVTRGFIGDDNALIQAITNATANYKVPTVGDATTFESSRITVPVPYAGSTTAGSGQAGKVSAG